MKCPYCGKSERWKWNRPSWMRWTPGPMELWRCASCGKEYTIYWWIFTIQNHNARTIVAAWRIVLAALLIFAISYIFV